MNLFNIKIMDSAEFDSILWTCLLVSTSAISIALLYYRRKKDGLHHPPSPPIWRLFLTYARSTKLQTVYKDTMKLPQYCSGSDIISIKTPLMKQRVIMVTGWPAAKEVLKLDSIVLGRYKSVFTEKFTEGKGLIFTDGVLWREHRNFLSKSLKENGYGNKSMEVFVEEQCLKLLSEIDSTLGQPVDTEKILQLPVLNTLWKVLSGEEMKLNKSELENLAKWLHLALDLAAVMVKYSAFIYPIQLLVWLIYRRQINDLKAKAEVILKNVVDVHKLNFNPENPTDYIDLFFVAIQKELNSPRKTPIYTDDTLIGVLKDMFVAGIEGNSKALSFALMHMARYPDIQTRVQKEIDAGIGKKFPRYEDRAKLVFTQATVLESLRKAPIVLMTSLHRTTAPCKIQGFDIPTGTSINTHIFSILHDERYWNKPDEFIPDRFINSDGQLSVPEWYIPYSIGKRTCFGESLSRMNSFIFFTCMMQHYTVEFSPNHKEPDFDDIRAEVTISVPHHRIIFKKRT